MITTFLQDCFTDFNYRGNYYFNYNTTQPLINNIIKTDKGEFAAPETAIDNTINFAYSYDEEITFKQNSQRELTFKMLKYIQLNSQWVLNPYAANLSVGSLIRLHDRYYILHDFIVTKISYNFKNANIEIVYNCQDMFSYKHIRQNSGYTISNDETKEDFIGAMTIDAWAEKIVKDCFITYTYLPLNSIIYVYRQDPNNDKSSRIITTNIPPEPYTILRDNLSTEDSSTFNASITFSISNSNALNALISLASQRGLNLQIDDENRVFYFIPEKNEEFNGFYYTPQLNISSFTPSQQGQSLTTILNVTGQTLNDVEVTMLPSIPSYFLNLFNSRAWQQAKYEPNYFSYLIKSKINQWYTTEDNKNENQLYWNIDDSLTEVVLTYSSTIPIGQYEYVTWDSSFLIYYEDDTASNPSELDIKQWDWIIEDDNSTKNFIYLNMGNSGSDPTITASTGYTYFYYNFNDSEWYYASSDTTWQWTLINTWRDLILFRILRRNRLRTLQKILQRRQRHQEKRHLLSFRY